MAAVLSEDVVELKALLKQATRPHVQSLISSEIQTLEKVAALSAQNQGKATLLHTTKTVPEVRYTSLSSFSWDQDVEKLKIYISLQGASKEKIDMDFKARSLELKVHDIDGKNYRLGVPCLCKAIVPEKCSVIAKPTRITIILKKLDKGTWQDLHGKEDKSKLRSDDKEPMSGLMQVMKNMYDDGDDEMKRNIAKAYSEAREGKSPGMRNF
ncbi:hypothetical protein GOP47_0007030 [Adiantum capillus-veneris]|uniref:Calcyclin-binding protein n=1 Tax=Adiantum capillus-veneris TaxID=13818 RepID=A0A9D4UZW1_ADICA|nr:hypothetical protein GOP47_0007030 [Adiantum capillus-veneris]